MSAPIESAVYKIIPAGLHKLVISLEKGNPRDSLVVEEPKPNELALYQQWAVVHQSDGIYTFRSLIKEFEGKEIEDAKKPYARNYEDFADSYIRGGAFDFFATYRIRRVSPNTFTIGLPNRLIVWSIIGDSRNIILNEYDDAKDSKKEQLWKFEKISDLPYHDGPTL